MKDADGNTLDYSVEYNKDETDIDGNVFAKVFTLKLANVTSVVSISIPATVTNYAGKEVTAYNKDFTELKVLPGDVNSDGVVDTLDRMVLNRYLANWEGYTADTINMTAADVNGDNVVDTLDRMTLNRYLANWEGYESLPCAG